MNTRLFSWGIIASVAIGVEVTAGLDKVIPFLNALFLGLAALLFSVMMVSLFNGIIMELRKK